LRKWFESAPELENIRSRKRKAEHVEFPSSKRVLRDMNFFLWDWNTIAEQLGTQSTGSVPQEPLDKSGTFKKSKENGISSWFCWKYWPVICS
jgi:hypothetical protein